MKKKILFCDFTHLAYYISTRTLYKYRARIFARVGNFFFKLPVSFTCRVFSHSLSLSVLCLPFTAAENEEKGRPLLETDVAIFFTKCLFEYTKEEKPSSLLERNINLFNSRFFYRGNKI